MTPPTPQTPSVDPTKAQLVRQFKHNRAIGSVRFDRSGRYLFAGSEDYAIQRWELETGSQTTLDGHSSWVRGFVFPPEGKEFISSGYDGNLIWWPLDSARPEPAAVVKAHAGWIRGIALSPDGRLIATCGNDHLVKLWSAVERKLVMELSGHRESVSSVAFHPDGKQFVSADLHCSVRQWNIADGKQVRELDASSMYFQSKSNRGNGGGLRSMAFSPDGRLLFGSGIAEGADPLGQAVNPGVIVFDWETGQKKITLRARGTEQGVAWGVICHPSGTFVAAVSGGISAKHLYFWSPQEEKPIHVVDLPAAAHDATLHPDGQRLAIALHDGTAAVYSIA